LEDVNEYYRFTNSRVFIVQHGDNCIYKDDKGVTDQITFVQEITADTLPHLCESPYYKELMSENLDGALVLFVTRKDAQSVLYLLKHGADAQARDNYALRWSAQNGLLDVVKCLKDVYGLETVGAQTYDNWALRYSAANGYLDVVKYLKDAFGLDKVDAQADNNYALRRSAARGHLDVVKYLKEAFGLDKADAQADDNYALRYSAAYGHLEVVKYLKEAFGLEDVYVYPLH